MPNRWILAILSPPPEILAKLVCLICHHLLCPYPRTGRDTVSLQVVKADPQRHLNSADLWTAATEIQGHLILHFEVEEEPVFNLFSESSWSQIPSDTQRSFDYWAEFGESAIAPGGDPTPSNLLDWERGARRRWPGKKFLLPKLPYLTLITAWMPLLAARNEGGRLKPILHSPSQCYRPG